MTSMDMGPTLPASVPMMAAMMMPGAVPAIARRARERVRSGRRVGLYCFGSSIGLMLVLVAVDVMSITLMCAIAVVVLAQKLLPPDPVVDVPLAVAIVALGVAIAAT